MVLSSGATDPVFSVLYRDPANALVSIPSDLLAHIDILLPRLFVPIAIPATPLPLPDDLTGTPVPPAAVHYLENILAGLRFNPIIAAAVSGISTDQMRRDIRWLTGEDGAGPTTRRSWSKGARDAADWIQNQIEQTGARCVQKIFIQGFAPNAVCRYPSASTENTVAILSAHYDSTTDWFDYRAPGANDDGSGVLPLLAAARVIHQNRIAFRGNVELVAFAGEEQGLLGSRAYANELKAAGTNVTIMVQADELAFHSASEQMQVGFPRVESLLEATYLVGNITNLYSPELKVGFTPACCSDQQRFHALGFPSTWVFERAGAILDPFYHKSGDISDRPGYDFNQVRSIAKATVRIRVCFFFLAVIMVPILMVIASGTVSLLRCWRLPGLILRSEVMSNRAEVGSYSEGTFQPSTSTQRSRGSM
ncbi:hypothetical protein BOTBODRAFT_621875 [Botryobasidium botryosum FD-172 SS1]|uniref:Peptide hydrolase n=1 Tax=Botryobasidium botryosum (strain FD-172 SS1) TaxID=930990 RepID=A0A067LTB7_BOTB1|nr:hypothetical protein BOTBODRAFT_621875 [Botryobasidium botryosum FD-172 SS1]